MRRGRVYVVLLAGAVCVHGAAAAWLRHREGRIDAHAFRSLDSTEYYLLARNLVQQRRFSQEASALFSPDTWRTPGYPLFLSAVNLVAGESPTAMIISQHLLGILSVLLLYTIALRYMQAHWAGLASAVFLLDPYRVYYAFWLLSTTFLTFILLVSWWAWERVRIKPTIWNWLLVGGLSGFVVLIWPGAILVPVALIVGATTMRFFAEGRSTDPPANRCATASAFVFAAVFLIAACLPPLMWMARNKLVAGHFSLSHQSGIVLAYFKATEVELWRQGRTEDRYVETSTDPHQRDKPHSVWEQIDLRLRQRLGVDAAQADGLTWPNLVQGNKTPLNSIDISRELTAIGWDMLAAMPGSAAACGIVRVAENLTFPLSLAFQRPQGVATSRVRAGLLGAAYLGLVVAACAGWWRAARQPAAWIFPVACLIALVLTVTPQVDPRFRVPMIPLLAFVAMLPAVREES